MIPHGLRIAENNSLVDADEGWIFVEPIGNLSDDIAGRVSPASKNQDCEGEILMVGWLLPLSVVVKIKLRAHQNVFADHLGLVKGENG